MRIFLDSNVLVSAVATRGLSYDVTAEFWLNGQRNWDLWHAMRSPEAADIGWIEPVTRQAG